MYLHLHAGQVVSGAFQAGGISRERIGGNEQHGVAFRTTSKCDEKTVRRNEQSLESIM